MPNLWIESLPTILVKCVNSYTGAQRTDCLHYRKTYIAQIFGVIIFTLCIWAVTVSTAPIVVSFPLLLLIYNVLLQPLLAPEQYDPLYDHQYHEVVKVNWSLREFILQLYIPRYQEKSTHRYSKLRLKKTTKLSTNTVSFSLWRHQFSDNDYKQLIANLTDESMDLIWIKKGID